VRGTKTTQLECEGVMKAPTECCPTMDEVNAWCDDILRRAADARLQVTFLPDPAYDFKLAVRHTGGVYLRCWSQELGEFYCFWQPCPSGRGPVLFHLPGYGAEMSAHPELVADGYNVLHINPLGYATPHGPDEAKQRDGTWPVMAETLESHGEHGYRDWLSQAAAAALWALEQDGVDGRRFAFFGTSQGGGTSLLLASIFRDRGVRAAAADVPFMINYAVSAKAETSGAYSLVASPLAELAKKQPGEVEAMWRAIGFVDAMHHAHRLTMPVLLTAGADDQTCPADSIRSLFDRLPGTRSYAELAGQGHAYTTPFLHLTRAWFRLYV
jgi:cephalosporin-C deacetylase-like acetyl esterase